MCRSTSCKATLAVGLLLAVAAARAVGDNNQARQAATAAGAKPDDAQIARGKYLVHHVAMCVQCHSPRDREGELIRGQLLQGAPMPLRSPYPETTWALKAPRIAGLPGWRAEDAVQFLQTGRAPDGWTAQPPMPRFRFNEQDARAVVAYLLSL